MRLQLPPGSSTGSTSLLWTTLTDVPKDSFAPPWMSSQDPPAVLQDPAAAVDDLHRCVEHDAVEVQRADVLTARVGVVVVAERTMHRADAALLRRGPERRDLADAEGELSDHRRVLDPVDHLAQPVRIVAALDLDGLALLDGPGDRLGHLPGQPDSEHHPVDHDRPVRAVLDGGPRHLGPQRERSHHLAAPLDR